MTRGNTGLYSELEDKDKIYNSSECTTLMLEAGADFERRVDGDSNFEWILISQCLVGSRYHLIKFDVSF